MTVVDDEEERQKGRVPLMQQMNVFGHVSYSHTHARDVQHSTRLWL